MAIFRRTSPRTLQRRRLQKQAKLALAELEKAEATMTRTSPNYWPSEEPEGRDNNREAAKEDEDEDEDEDEETEDEMEEQHEPVAAGSEEKNDGKDGGVVFKGTEGPRAAGNRMRKLRRARVRAARAAKKSLGQTSKDNAREDTAATASQS